jgi:hypothetical protein
MGHEEELIPGRYIKQGFAIGRVVDLDWGNLERALLNVPAF